MTEDCTADGPVCTEDGRPLCRVGRRRVTPCYRSTFPSAPLRTGRSFHRIRLSSGLYPGWRIASPVMDVHVARPAGHEGLALPRRHDLYLFGLVALAFHVQVTKRTDVMDFDIHR